ncbi:glycoside hydrolase domain-containing protein, partial [Streptomyces sp. NPDC005573]|uniref:glycoside hydrolase domain-containing protein n=1 Tax=Streptomyces sp. NPDC005573 TaxID=3156890 RepID=UPI0033AF4D9F
MTNRHLRRAAAALTTVGALSALLQCGTTASAAGLTTGVTYHGLTVDVPSDWTVIDLAAAPHTCVRMDRHIVYLGHPDAEQTCPSHLVDEKTEALVLETFDGAGTRADVPQVEVPAGSSAPRSLPDGESREVRVAFDGAGVYATASHGDSSALMDDIIGSVRISGTAEPRRAPAPAQRPDRQAAGSLAAATPSTSYKGKAFDACSAPSSGTMQDWSASPYGGVAVYIGGPSRACAQPNLTASWVSQQSGDGWHLLPVYAGLMADDISSSDAAGQGRSAADDAVDLAQGLGFVPGTVLYVDMESYPSTYRTNVLNYLSGWAERIHQLGFRSGVYSSSSSGIKDLSSVYTSTTLTRPDVVWVANWNGQADTSDVNLPSDQWADHQRVHQYAGNVSETYGGTTVQIDRDYVDVGAPAPSTQDPGMTELTAGDFNGDGHADLVAVEVSTGKLFSYPGNGKGVLGARVEIGTGGWNGMSNLAVGDFNGDGRDDLVGTETSTGKLWLYKGTGSGLS